VSVSPVATLPATRSSIEPVSVFLMIHCFEMGGSERQLSIVARSLDRTRFQALVGCNRRTGSLAGEFPNAPEFRLGGSLYGWRSLAARVRLGRHLRRARVQVAHSFDFYTNLTLIPAARLARVPVVIGSHRQIGDLMTAMQFRAQAAAFRGCDAVVCNSQAGADRLAEAGIAPKKLVVIGNALLDSAFESVPPALPIRPGLRRVCMVARMNAEYKNHGGFLRIAAEIRRRNPNVEFVLVGDGPLRTKLERDAATLGLGDAVQFLGERNDIAAVLASVDVAVLTSDSEGLSNVILEAMGARLPVVAYNVGGNSELINDSRGTLVRPGDEKEFANAVQQLLGDDSLRQRFGINARRFAEENFGVALVCRRYEELYTSLLEDKLGRDRSS